MSRTLIRVALLAPLLALHKSAQDVPVSRLECAPVATPSDTSSGRIGMLAVGPRGRLAWSEGGVLAPQVRDAQGRVRTVGDLTVTDSTRGAVGAARINRDGHRPRVRAH
jgi:hypothetical protein